MNEITIENINSFINNIKKENSNLKDYEIVYRAPTKEKEENICFSIEQEKPSLFHSQNFIANEKEIYHDFIAANPSEFENMTTFDRLTKMRHYNLPNRLLDVTTDPFVALFFACGKKNDGSGKIILYKVKKENVKNFDSDTVAILSMLTNLKIDDQKLLNNIIDSFKIYGEKQDEKQEISNVKKNLQILNIDEKAKEKAIDFFYNLEHKGKKEFTTKDFFNMMISVFVPELTWQLKREIPGWYENVFNIKTFTQCYLVKPKMNNPRIIAQSGAFFIYPFEDTDIKTALLQEDPYKVYKINNIEKMKQDLEALNIKEIKYIPDDLTVYAEEIREKYKNA